MWGNPEEISSKYIQRVAEAETGSKEFCLLPPFFFLLLGDGYHLVNNNIMYFTH